MVQVKNEVGWQARAAEEAQEMIARAQETNKRTVVGESILHKASRTSSLPKQFNSPAHPQRAAIQLFEGTQGKVCMTVKALNTPNQDATS